MNPCAVLEPVSVGAAYLLYQLRVYGINNIIERPIPHPDEMPQDY
jgi:hypothetical protein